MKRIALLGMPNTGKSTLFNRMTGGAARVGNWPGITVELLCGKILLGADMVEIIDLPGIYDLHGFSADEEVVRNFLHDNVPDLALVILNATQIERQMSLLLQLKQLNMNIVVLLNMADEAIDRGVMPRLDELEKRIGIPAIPTVGTTARHELLPPKAYCPVPAISRFDNNLSPIEHYRYNKLK